MNTLLSVGASRPICQSCRDELAWNVGYHGGCYEPLGGKSKCTPKR